MERSLIIMVVLLAIVWLVFDELTGGKKLITKLSKSMLGSYDMDYSLLKGWHQ